MYSVVYFLPLHRMFPEIKLPSSRRVYVCFTKHSLGKKIKTQTLEKNTFGLNRIPSFEVRVKLNLQLSFSE